MNFTHNNHLSYTVGDRIFGYRETPYDKFSVTVGRVDPDHYKKSNWVKEQFRTAQLVYDEFGKDLVVMFSGGTDSEIVLRVYAEMNIKPRCVFVKFKDDYNHQDYLYAVAICNELSLKLEAIEFDVKDFYLSGQAAEFSSEINCRQMAYLSVYHHIRLLNQPAIMGGEVFLRRHTTPTSSQWQYVFRENEDASAMRFSLKYNIPLVNEWFSYTPEMIAYYLENPNIKKLVTDKYNYKLSSVSSKNAILQEYMPSIMQKTKTHGYEKLVGFNMETYNSLYLTHTKKLENSLDGIFLSDLIQMLHGDNYAYN